MNRRKIRLARGEIKKRNRKITIVSISLLFVLSVGYGAFQTILNVTVTGKIKIDSECVEGKVWAFEQEDYGQEFKVPCSGDYKVELWGASGGGCENDSSLGGKGGYTTGLISLKKNKKYYIYVGAAGETDVNSSGANGVFYSGGYNGGGDSTSNSTSSSGSGGGASDIRTINDSWNNFVSLKSRIMVASGGAGSSYWYDRDYLKVGNAGGLIGYDGQQLTYSGTPNTVIISNTLGATQVLGGKNTIGNIVGVFGYSNNAIKAAGGGSGGGGGYYGGAAGYDQGRSLSGGSGGSSFISGHNGCDAISEQSTENNIIHTGQSIHYSGLYFTNTIMIDGAGYKWTDHKLEDLGVIGMPTHSGTGTMTGNEGDGFAKITLITRKPN